MNIPSVRILYLSLLAIFAALWLLFHKVQQYSRNPRQTSSQVVWDLSAFVAHRSNVSRANESCRLPSVEPDPSWKPTAFKPLDCPKEHEDYVDVRVVNGRFLAFNEAPLACFYQEVVFKMFDYRTRLRMPLPLRMPKQRSSLTPCPVEVFQLECFRGRQKVLTSLLRCFNKKPGNSRDGITFPIVGPFSERLNILMLGLDSMSRVAWLEQLPKTVHYASDVLNGITFDGYNIIGDGTTAAFLGFLTGFMEDELHEARRGFKGAKTVDDFPFIFRQLREDADYVTLWDEDGAGVGTFQFRLLGFTKPPVDYYGRKFQLSLKKPEDGCLGKISAFEEMFHQFRHLFAAHPDPRRKFGLIFNSAYTHTEAGVQEGYRLDAFFADELKFLHQQNYLNESLLILFSDHGSRFGGARATYRGKVAERLPYLTFVFPNWFREKYQNEMANLLAASKQLTTPFDLHATLLEIAGLVAIRGTPQRGISFFSQIPRNRTCEDAGVLPHWCSCLEGEEMPLNDTVVEQALRQFEVFVNEELFREVAGECAPLTVRNTTSARLLGLRPEVAYFIKSVDRDGREPQFGGSHPIADANMQVSFSTEPGDGLWEVTFSWNQDSGQIDVLPKQISRINRYGSAPWCIEERYPHLRQFCVCMKQQ